MSFFDFRLLNLSKLVTTFSRYSLIATSGSETDPEPASDHAMAVETSAPTASPVETSAPTASPAPASDHAMAVEIEMVVRTSATVEAPLDT